MLVFFVSRVRLSPQTSELQCALFLCASCFHAITKPYKLNIMNNVNIVILFLLEILILVMSTSNSPTLTFIILVTTLLLLIPHMILIFYICHKLAKKIGITQCLKRKYETLKRCLQITRPNSEAEADVEADTDFLPDRLINPGEYEQVLPTTEEHKSDWLTEDKQEDSEEPRRLILVYTYGSIN